MKQNNTTVFQFRPSTNPSFPLVVQFQLKFWLLNITVGGVSNYSLKIIDLMCEEIGLITAIWYLTSKSCKHGQLLARSWV